jgi:hypothetical protein
MAGENEDFFLSPIVIPCNLLVLQANRRSESGANPAKRQIFQIAE